MNSTLSQQQRDFAAFLRGKTADAPPDVAPTRMAVYRRLFFNTMEGLLAANFPVIRRTLEDLRWNSLVEEFHREHRCSTPRFTEVAQEFIAFLSERSPAMQDPGWLPELAHYEWMELRAQVDDTPLPPHSVDGDVLEGMPVLHPQAWPLAYAWEVTRIGPHHQPDAPGAEPTLLLVRRDLRDEVHFAALSPPVFRLLQLIEGNTTASGEALIAQLAHEAGLQEDAAFAAEAAAILRRMHDEGTVIGTRPA